MIRRVVVPLLVLGVLGASAAPVAAQNEPEADPRAPYRFTIGESPREGRAPVPEHVIGTDDRRQVTNTTKSTPRKVVHIVFTIPGQGDFICTGSLIAPDVVATAAHCLYDTVEDVAATNFRVFPGRSSRKDKPYGKCTATNNDAAVPQGFKDAENPVAVDAVPYDYGAVRIDCNQTLTTFFDLAVHEFTQDVTLNMNAYHGDKPLGTQWKTKDITVGSFADVPLLVYRLDTFGGSSGAALVNKSLSGCTCILAINTLEQVPWSNGARRNAGVMVTADVKAFFDGFEAG